MFYRQCWTLYLERVGYCERRRRGQLGVPSTIRFETLNAKAHQTARWLTTQFHGLAWDSGDVSYGEVPNIISRFCAPFSRIYTKGLEKTIFLREFLKESDCCVINSEDLDSTIKNDCFTVSPPVCLRHTSKILSL